MSTPSEPIPNDWLGKIQGSEIRLTAEYHDTHLHPDPREIVLDLPRPWAERMFSRPWRPHHNVRRWEFRGRVSGSEGDYTIHPIGKITETTART